MAQVGRIVGGIVLVAIVVGIGLWAERQTDDELALPDEVAGLPVDESPNGSEFAQAISERLSEAYDDADSVVGRYRERGGEFQLMVTAVRAKSGPPVPAFFSANHDWVEDDDVVCLLTHETQQTKSILCQRDDGDLTVRVFALGSESLDADDLVDATNDVWEDLS